MVGTISINEFSAKNSTCLQDNVDLVCSMISKVTRIGCVCMCVLIFLKLFVFVVSLEMPKKQNKGRSRIRDQQQKRLAYPLTYKSKLSRLQQVISLGTAVFAVIVTMILMNGKNLYTTFLTPLSRASVQFGSRESVLTRRFVARKAVCLLDGTETTDQQQQQRTFSSLVPSSGDSPKTTSMKSVPLAVGFAAFPHPTKAELWNKIEEMDKPLRAVIDKGNKETDKTSDDRVVVNGPENGLRNLYVAHGAGQDAYYVHQDGLLAVADGVGAWADGEAVARLSRLLIGNIATCFLDSPERDPVKLVRKSYDLLPKELLKSASTTVVVGVIDAQSGVLNIANLGDSGIRVARPGRGIVFATSEQQHFDNCPFQLGGGSTDMPEHAKVYALNVVPGDIVIAASDGLFDNLFDHEIEQSVKGIDDPSKIAHRLLELAIEVTYPTESSTFAGKPRLSPFAKKYNLANWIGGKPDDISVVVGVVKGKQQVRTE